MGPSGPSRQTRHPQGTLRHHLGCLGDWQLGRYCGSWSDTGSEFGKLGGGHGCGPQEISCSGEKREQVLESSVLQPPFNSTLFQKGLEVAHRNTS